MLKRRGAWTGMWLLLMVGMLLPTATAAQQSGLDAAAKVRAAIIATKNNHSNTPKAAVLQSVLNEIADNARRSVPQMRNYTVRHWVMEVRKDEYVVLIEDSVYDVLPNGNEQIAVALVDLTRNMCEFVKCRRMVVISTKPGGYIPVYITTPEGIAYPKQ